MLIQILGYNVETDHIYAVSPITDIIGEGSYSRFTIHFINHKDINIQCNEKSKLAHKQVEDVREQLIYFWNKSHSDIPKIELKR